MRRELRDRLGELLAEALVDPARLPPLHWLHAYCQAAAVRGQPVVPFHDVLRRAIETADAFPFDPVGAAGSALVALGVLELRRAGEAVKARRIPIALEHNGWDVEISQEHRLDMGEVTIKVRAFWDALRRVYEGASGPAKHLEEVLARAATFFNVGLYFEFHEILEGYWMGQAKGPARQFLQGLIQISIGFYQIRRHNPVGALAQFEKGLEKVESLGDSYLGIELAHFRPAVRKCRNVVAQLGETRIAEFDPALIPPMRTLRAASP